MISARKIKGAETATSNSANVIPAKVALGTSSRQAARNVWIRSTIVIDILGIVVRSIDDFKTGLVTSTCCYLLPFGSASIRYGSQLTKNRTFGQSQHSKKLL
jgi:hypothetical protein